MWGLYLTPHLPPLTMPVEGNYCRPATVQRQPKCGSVHVKGEAHVTGRGQTPFVRDHLNAEA